jgi:tRNA (guanine37-N1)-methyltransferase
MKSEKIKKPRSLKVALSEKLSPEEMEHAPRAFDTIGDIAIVEIPEELEPKKKAIAESLLNTFKHVNVVVSKASKVETEYRTRAVEILAGEKRKETIHKEAGCSYFLDVEKAYFSPRLGTERMRVADKVKPEERVLVMFAGVGPYAILIEKAKHPRETVAIELNPDAVEYMRRNASLNKVKIKIIEGDAKTETPKLGKFDRIVMPLPKDAGDFLDVAINALNKNGTIHFYDFGHSTDEAEKKAEELCENLGYKIKVLESVTCGSYGPGIFRTCVDFTVSQ